MHRSINDIDIQPAEHHLTLAVWTNKTSETLLHQCLTQAGYPVTLCRNVSEIIPTIRTLRSSMALLRADNEAYDLFTVAEAIYAQPGLLHFPLIILFQHDTGDARYRVARMRNYCARWLRTPVGASEVVHFTANMIRHPLYAQSRFEEAEALLAQEPNNPRGYSKRGDAFLSLHDLDAAKAELDRALGLNPEYAEAYLLRAECYITLDERSQCCENLRKAAQFGQGEVRETALSDLRTLCGQ